MEKITETIKKLITEHGLIILEQEQRLKAILSDLHPSEKRFRYLLGLSLHAEIPKKLIAIQNESTSVWETQVGSIKHYFKEEFFLEDSAVKLVFDCWEELLPCKFIEITTPPISDYERMDIGLSNNANLNISRWKETLVEDISNRYTAGTNRYYIHSECMKIDKSATDRFKVLYHKHGIEINRHFDEIYKPSILPATGTFTGMYYSICKIGDYEKRGLRFTGKDDNGNPFDCANSRMNMEAIVKNQEKPIVVETDIIYMPKKGIARFRGDQIGVSLNYYLSKQPLLGRKFCAERVEIFDLPYKKIFASKKEALENVFIGYCYKVTFIEEDKKFQTIWDHYNYSPSASEKARIARILELVKKH